MPTDRLNQQPETSTPGLAIDEAAEQREFYRDVMRRLLDTGRISLDMSILVTAGGETDRAVLEELGFTQVMISNLDSRLGRTDFSPFTWSRQDVENLTVDADSFDFCVVHSGLHHCYSPHRGLLEMYRVAREGILLFEPYDNLLTRLGVKLGFGQEYECAAVVYNDFAYGGVGNTAIPNYVMRLTRNEIRKAIRSNAPYGDHQFLFFHRMRIPWTQLRGRRRRLFLIAAALAAPVLHAIGRVFPTQCNNFAAAVFKPKPPQDLHPWLRWDQGVIKPDESWLTERFKSTSG